MPAMPNCGSQAYSRRVLQHTACAHAACREAVAWSSPRAPRASAGGRPAQQVFKFFTWNAGQHGRVRDLVAIEMEDSAGPRRPWRD